jgi:2-polyprenyl-3-methyl-5-hydroxy-6-metoxy-1,4-benzoquinol methylase
VFKAFSRKGLERIKNVWGTERVWGGKEIQHWLQHPLVQERINLKTSGSAQINRFEYFLNGYLDAKMPVERALTLGSGLGDLERGLCQYGFAQSHQGVDLSDEAVRIATESARASGLDHLSYHTADLNTIKLEREAYDVIFGISSVHHIGNLEHLLRQVRQALRPSGYFFLDEFVGPNRFQWTDAQLKSMNDQLRHLPKELRRRISDRKRFKERVVRETVGEVIASDPSEAVRSSEIVPLLTEYFRIVEIKGYGGAILHQLLYDIAGNFCEENAGSLDHLRRLFALEDELTASGAVSNDFAVIIATTKAV